MPADREASSVLRVRLEVAREDAAASAAESRPFTRMPSGSGLTFRDQLVSSVFTTGGLTTEVRTDSVFGAPYDDSLM